MTRRSPAPRPIGAWRSAAVPALLAAAAAAFVVGIDPGHTWTGDHAAARAAAALLAVILAAAAAVLWQGEREATRVRRALAAGISHHMRTPLAQIRMFTEMLLMGRERSEEERNAWLETIERESHRLGDVMENLLLFVHGEEDDPFPTRQPTDLGALVEDVAVGYTSRAAAARMRIDIDPPAGVVVRVDPQAVRQAVGNLIDNALRYGAAGQTVAVSLHADADGPAIVTVADQGSGIPAPERARVWNAFVRLDAATDTAAGGGGLGLAVARQVVEAHGGRAWIEDAPGGGAAVRLALPRVRSGPRPTATPPSANAEFSVPSA